MDGDADPARIGRDVADLWSRLVALEGQERIHLGIFGKDLDRCGIGGAGLGHQLEAGAAGDHGAVGKAARLAAIDHAGDIHHIAGDERRQVDGHAAIRPGGRDIEHGDRDKSEAGGNAVLFLGRTALGAKARILEDHRDLLADAAKGDHLGAPHHAAIEADVGRPKAAAHMGGVEKAGHHTVMTGHRQGHQDLALRGSA